MKNDEIDWPTIWLTHWFTYRGSIFLNAAKQFQTVTRNNQRVAFHMINIPSFMQCWTYQIKKKKLQWTHIHVHTDTQSYTSAKLTHTHIHKHTHPHTFYTRSMSYWVKLMWRRGRGRRARKRKIVRLQGWLHLWPYPGHTAHMIAKCKDGPCIVWTNQIQQAPFYMIVWLDSETLSVAVRQRFYCKEFNLIFSWVIEKHIAVCCYVSLFSGNMDYTLQINIKNIGRAKRSRVCRFLLG